MFNMNEFKHFKQRRPTLKTTLYSILVLNILIIHRYTNVIYY